MDISKHTRRDFLRLAGLSAAGVVVAACATPEPQVVEKVVQETVEVTKIVEVVATSAPEKEPEGEAEAEPTATPEPEPEQGPSKYSESPMLAERVAAGELPPVEERLPEDVRVCPLIGEVGEYGGTLTVASLTTLLWAGDAEMAMDRPNLLRISQDATHATEHILKDWEVSDDFMSVTCHMRKGMKWSDGEPLTVEDYRYWYEDMLLNTEITPVPTVKYRPGGELMQFDIIDDYTFKLSFVQPYPAFSLVSLAHQTGLGDNRPFQPAHYLKQFHIKYNDKATELAKAAGFDFWYQLHARESSRTQSIDTPRLTCYIPVRDTPQMSFSERNPYYHAVDPEGNQLPYIDKMNMSRVVDLSTLDAQTVGGSFDFAAMELRILNYATYADGAAASNARMLLWQSGKGGEVIYNVNCNWADEEWAEVFYDDRFRQALSLAINRADINNVIYFGNASETQFTVVPVSKHYSPEYALAYAEFDLDRANALLDEMGLEWNAAKTHRTWPTSKGDIIISWDLVETETPKGPITELITEYWKAIGIEIRWKSITRTLLSQKMDANEEPMSLWHGDETMDTLFLRTRKFFAPQTGDENCWGVMWGMWDESNGEQGWEPPQYIKDLFVWTDEYGVNESPEAAQKVLASQAEHIWTIGSVGNAPHPIFVRNTLRNVSELGGYWTWDSLWTYPEFPEQWWLQQS
ncbi:MAG: ABC transporter substrate-binding protein [Anaerolineae bacterium]|jgi:peptide/nickel transport system substrate-binding protein|nr:twin-arginine translocation signal domain-containing protein [Chloroflexota bacterium]